MKKILKILFVSTLFVLCAFMACCASDNYYDSYSTDSGESKNVYRTSLSIDTDDVSESKEKVLSKISQFNGNIISSYEYSGEDYGRSEIVFTVDNDKANDFVSWIEQNEKVTHKDVSHHDVMGVVNSTFATKQSLESRKARLEALYEEAKSVEEKRLVDADIYDVEKQLREMEMQLNTYDSLSAQTRISVSIEKEYDDTADIILTILFIVLFIGLIVVTVLLAIRVSTLKTILFSQGKESKKNVKNKGE